MVPAAYFASPPKYGGHRLLADIRDSIAELRYYRSAVFVAPPGPDTARLARSPRSTDVPQADPTEPPASTVAEAASKRSP